VVMPFFKRQCFDQSHCKKSDDASFEVCHVYNVTIILVDTFVTFY